MVAKQITVSASLVVALGGSALAQPAATAPSDPTPSEAPPEPPPEPSEAPPEPPAPEPTASEAPLNPPSTTPSTPIPSEAPRHRPTGSFFVGAGYNTDDSFLFSAGISQPDLFHTGNALKLDAQLSGRLEKFELDFAHPHLFGGNAVLDTSLYNERRVLPGFARNAVGGQVTVRTPLGDHVTGFLTFRVEHVRAEALDDSLIARGGEPSPALNEGTIASLRTGIEYSTLDHKVAPVSGTSAGLAFETADAMLGSDYQLAKLNAWANTHQSLGPVILHVGGSISSVTSKDPGGVPLSERLYLDGSSELRGYAPGALVPGGGTFEALGRAEVELPVWRRAGLSVVGFYDVGMMTDIHGFGSAGHSVGFGILWRSPIGPLSFDWAVPLDGGKPGFLLNVGGVF